jgi:hypothetical protein
MKSKVPSIKSKTFKEWCKAFAKYNPCSYSTLDEVNLYEIFVLGYK